MKMELGEYGMTYLLRLVACLFLLLSFNAKALVVNGCTIEPHTSCWFADLSGALLTFADLYSASLYGADLSDAILTNAVLHSVELADVNLTGADLSGADLNGVYLLGANMSYANLTNANLHSAELAAVNLTGAYLLGADLTDADLTDAFLYGALYNDQTVFTNTHLSFDPIAAGMSYVPVPAAAWLFGSALVGLGLVRRNK